MNSATALKCATPLTMRLTKLGCAVVREPTHSLDPRYGQELKKLATCAWGVLLTEEVDSLMCDAHGAPAVCFKHFMHILFRDGLDLPKGSIRSIVHHNIDSPEAHLGSSECGEDVLQLCDIELEREQAVSRVHCDEVGEGLSPAHGHNRSVAVFKDDLSKLVAEASRCASDCCKCAG